MKKTSLYLDTSVINFLFADDAPEKKEITIDFFENYVKKNIYEVFVSSVVIDEINKINDNIKKDKLLNVIKTYKLKMLDISFYHDEIKNLSKKYIENRVIPVNKVEDALHIAISTVYEIDILLSWNYRHLANLYKERKIVSINISEGYSKELKLTTPMEVIYEEE